ncbi:hypothetical protein PVAP13_9NG465000 [Panicum virgatum]|uniref:Uncharacterized protein n=1 Tax=Panicum virgatum TaxID=38727 RepID=A0A8T0MQ62_PANVG|nr:hypothetical protein PVAP13_9NG465000 [Panicum virgatum]
MARIIRSTRALALVAAAAVVIAAAAAAARVPDYHPSTFTVTGTVQCQDCTKNWNAYAYNARPIPGSVVGITCVDGRGAGGVPRLGRDGRPGGVQHRGAQQGERRRPRPVPVPRPPRLLGRRRLRRLQRRQDRTEAVAPHALQPRQGHLRRRALLLHPGAVRRQGDDDA